MPQLLWLAGRGTRANYRTLAISLGFFWNSWRKAPVILFIYEINTPAIHSLYYTYWRKLVGVEFKRGVDTA